jgi:hypothetical protein
MGGRAPKGESQVDAFRIDGATVSGTASFIDTYAGTAPSPRGHSKRPAHGTSRNDRGGATAQLTTPFCIAHKAAAARVLTSIFV